MSSRAPCGEQWQGTGKSGAVRKRRRRGRGQWTVAAANEGRAGSIARALWGGQSESAGRGGAKRKDRPRGSRGEEM